jgi:Fe/S biogenesis protein NfuA
MLILYLTNDALMSGVFMIEEIKKVIETDINPQLELHAGGCELIDVDDGVVTIRLYGGCSGCPSSQITLFNGIVPILKERVPDVKDVVLG